jgi:CRISPR-associated endonuclease Cas2
MNAMLLVMYDIENTKTRTRLAKFLRPFGRRLPFSVFESVNSPRVLDNIRTELATRYEKYFGQSDSVLIFEIPDNACIGRFGYPVNEETDLIMT